MRIDEVNALPADEFVRVLGGVWERSPWIPEMAANARPFADRATLFRAMAEIVTEAPQDRQMALVLAHPDLAGKFSRGDALTAESSGEQVSVGLDRLTNAEHARFTELNDAYRARFGFPFIVCVRNHTKGAILHAFGQRLQNPRDVEFQNALDEILRIAEYRINDLIDP